MRAAALLVACTGCDAVLGLDETRYAQPADAEVVHDTVDACGPSCQTFASCSALRAAAPDAPSGVYMIDAGTGTFRAYCEMTGDGGGWTLALKVDGSKPTFRYDEPIWTDATLLGADAPNLDSTEAKLETFNALAFTELRVGLEHPIGSGTVRWLVLPVAAARLRDLFGAQQLTTLGRTAWKELIGPTASLQPNCNEEGINVGNSVMRVRIGIIGNNEPDCMTPDSRLGIGGDDVAQCTFPITSSAGNSACYMPDNGEVELPAFGYVFVR